MGPNPTLVFKYVFQVLLLCGLSPSASGQGEPFQLRTAEGPLIIGPVPVVLPIPEQSVAEALPTPLSASAPPPALETQTPESVAVVAVPKKTIVAQPESAAAAAIQAGQDANANPGIVEIVKQQSTAVQQRQITVSLESVPNANPPSSAAKIPGGADPLDGYYYEDEQTGTDGAGAVVLTNELIPLEPKIEKVTTTTTTTTTPALVFFIVPGGNGTNGRRRRRKKRPILSSRMATSPASELTEASTIPTITYPPRKLIFMISASNLDRINRRTPPINPFAQLYYSSQSSDLHMQESEVLTRNVNPYFSKVFTFVWEKGTNQTWNIKLKNRNAPYPDEVLAEVNVNVDDYVEQSNENVAIAIGKTPKGASGAQLMIRKSSSLKLSVHARGLAHRDSWNGKSDPFVKFFWRRGVDGPDTFFGKTETVNNVEDADWSEIAIFDSYQAGSDQYLVFKVYDSDPLSFDEFLGQAFIKVDTLMGGESGQKRRTIELMNESGGRRKKDRITGSLTVVVFSIN